MADTENTQATETKESPKANKIETVRVRRIEGTEDNPVKHVTAVSVTDEKGIRYQTVRFPESESEFDLPVHQARQLVDIRTDKEKENDPRAEYKVFYFELAEESRTRPKSDDEKANPGAASALNKMRRDAKNVIGETGNAPSSDLRVGSNVTAEGKTPTPDTGSTK